MSLIFSTFTSHERVELGHFLLSNTNGKSYMGNVAAPSHLKSQGYCHSYFKPVSLRKEEIQGILNTSRKSYLENPVAPPGMSFGGLESSSSRSLIFQIFISEKGVELGYRLLFLTNRKSHMWSPTVPLDFISSNLDRSSSRSLISNPYTTEGFLIE